ncbi:site-specific DNA-cytosine methylase [Azospirillum sp. OGB3]|uniref:DNA cytosine methyltransferase n=1 Tax=Azospirillum sp. OGB3 TaxID=2587012 RepID=UPI0016065A39|nr:DNA cytosine methyltransferase [Azospirillum sp. OGB3]MBB3268776.1 site-specific DNA-cytosine methylase [Azospirillum sp. OGB3]
MSDTSSPPHLPRLRALGQAVEEYEGSEASVDMAADAERERLGEQRREHVRALARQRQKRHRAGVAKAGGALSIDFDAVSHAALAAIAERWGMTTKAAARHLVVWADAHRDAVTPPEHIAPEDVRRQPKTKRVTARTFRPRFVSMFAGIEAFSAATKDMGWRCAAVAQWDPSERSQYSAAVLAERLSLEVVNLGDIRYVRGKHLGGFDVLVGGSPCQSFSLAGRRRGTQDPRGKLTEAFLDIAVGSSAPVTLWENVRGVLSQRYDREADAGHADDDTVDVDNGRANAAYDDACDLFGSVLSVLCGGDVPIPRPRAPKGRLLSWPKAGVVRGPERTVVWRVLDASLFGLPQARKRLFVAATTHASGIDAVEVLFDKRPTLGEPEWTAGGMAYWGLPDAPEGPAKPKRLGNALARVFVRDPTEEEGYLITPEHAGAVLLRADKYVETCAKRGDKVARQHLPAWVRAALEVAAEGRASFPVADLAERLSGTPGAWKAFEAMLPPNPGGTAGARKDAVLVDAYGQKGLVTVRKRIACTMTAKYGQHRSARPFVIRREGDTLRLRALMPLEGERLMGFPDGWTEVKHWDHPKSPEKLRLRGLGNSMAVPVMAWIAGRMDKAIRAGITAGTFKPNLDGRIVAAFEQAKEPALWIDRENALFLGNAVRRAFRKTLVGMLRRHKGELPKAAD